jgi:chitinase domain-containing protein 1
LSEYRTTITWNPDTQEHTITWRDDDDEEHVLYYPTVASLQARVEKFGEVGVGMAVMELGDGLDYFLDVL